MDQELVKHRKHVSAAVDDDLLKRFAHDGPDRAFAGARFIPDEFSSASTMQVHHRNPVIDILEQTPRIPDSCQWAVVIVRVDYREGDPDDYSLPLAWAEGAEASRMLVQSPNSLMVEVKIGYAHGAQLRRHA